jgi:hypothetical protein
VPGALDAVVHGRRAAGAVCEGELHDVVADRGAGGRARAETAAVGLAGRVNAERSHAQGRLRVAEQDAGERRRPTAAGTALLAGRFAGFTGEADRVHDDGVERVDSGEGFDVLSLAPAVEGEWKRPARRGVGHYG